MATFNIEIRVVHIAGLFNIVSGALSRLQVIYGKTGRVAIYDCIVNFPLCR